jgi:hypothetical protein
VSVKSTIESGCGAVNEIANLSAVGDSCHLSGPVRTHEEASGVEAET